MPGRPALQKRVYKYDISSRDMKKNPRGCFRLICVFLTDELKLSALFLYQKSDIANINAKEIENEVKRLKSQLEEDAAPAAPHP